MTVVFHPEARKEMREAAEYYDRQSPGLGLRMVSELEREFARLLNNPLRNAPDALQRRKWRLKKFPYQIIYRAEAERVFVLAIAHNRRAPGYWKEREN